MRRQGWLVVLVLAGLALPLAADEGTTLQDALEDHALAGDWIYDDAEAGLAAGRETGKPVLVSFRCVP